MEKPRKDFVLGMSYSIAHAEEMVPALDRAWDFASRGMPAEAEKEAANYRAHARRIGFPFPEQLLKGLVELAYQNQGKKS
jgi:hypothetical protein